MKISGRERRLLGMLGLLAAVWALRTLWSLASPGDPGPAGADALATSPGPTGRARRGSEIPDDVVVVRTDLLDPADRGELEIGRDPFRFQPVVPPPPPPPTAEEIERRQREAEERAARERERLAELAKPRPPEVTLRYLGSFGPRSRRIAVFADAAGQNVINARAGDTLEGKFIVESIGFESVDLKFVGFPDVPARRLGISP